MTLIRLHDDILFDLQGCRLRISSEVICLEPKLAGLLAVLSQKNGEPVSRDELLETVWGGDVSDHALTQAVSRLRQIFGNRQIIKTVARVGYQLSGPPQALDDETLRQFEHDDVETGANLFLRQSSRSKIYLGVFLIIVTIALASPLYFEALPSSIQGIFCGACLPR